MWSLVTAAASALFVWVQFASAQDPALAASFFNMMGSLRPAKTVLRAIRAAEPDLFLTVSERLRGWGYPLETHTVRTEDGYLLTLHRIPYGRGGGGGANSSTNTFAARGPPVLLQHGLVSCSEFWIVGGPDRSPALELADRGYDVWLSNVRGTHYSIKHEKIGRRDKKFWKFSWHEMGVFDIPATIDYILNATGHERLFYVGHSMGNTMFYVAMSLRPEYNAKVRLQVALAPAVFLNETASGVAQLAIANAEYIKAAVETLPTYEILTKTDTAIALNYLLCSEKAYFNKLCAVLLSWIVGAMDLNNTTNVCFILSRSTSSTSALVAWHFAQISRSGEFAQMDNGVSENMRMYGSPRPPKYPLERVTTPVAVYASDADALVTLQGSHRLSTTLPNVVRYKVIHDKFFNHMEYVYHQNLNELLMDDVLETMAQF